MDTMGEEEEEKALFRSLGVTSADPQNIERDILEKEITNNRDKSEALETVEEEFLNRTKSNGFASTSHSDLYNKLRVMEIEIDAVASTVEQTKNLVKDEEYVFVSENEQGHTELPPSDLALQHALAADRLKSLKVTKARLEKEVEDLRKDDTSEESKHDFLIRELVKEEKTPKRRPKVQKSRKHPNKRLKKVLYDGDGDFDAVLNAASAGFVETERDALVRKGVLTPFHRLKGFERCIQEPGPSGSDCLADRDNGDDQSSNSIERVALLMSKAAQARPTTKLVDSEALPKLDPPTLPFQRLKTPLKIHQSHDGESLRKNKYVKHKKKRPSPGKKWQNSASRAESYNVKEDGNTSCCEEDENEDIGDVNEEDPSFVRLEGGLKIPDKIFNNLFDYQKVGVQWLWELHCQRVGGIIGDEMGLGKTVQVLAFLGALHFSKLYKPSIIVCPVTLLQQWKREARKWYPKCHIEILHDSAHDLMKQARSHETDSESEELVDNDDINGLSSRRSKKWKPLIDRVSRSESGLLITTYEQLRLLGEKLLDIDWGYAVLDEGHRIRNPNAEVTLVCKQLQTVHRIIMTGSPIQNKLTELWSLFDFVFPGKLGVLPVFEAEFAVPISVGGYANASPLQVSTAYRCAVVLRDLIMPYLLRRMKADVYAHLPKKTEHVLFCSLTSVQRCVYRAFLASSEVEQIFDGSRNSLSGIDVMRKICNHPDLLEREHSSRDSDYGNPERSGKMKVVSQVLKVWKEQGHRVLLFAQTQQMLDILENLLILGGYGYRRMDGLTPVKQRMALIDEFNTSDDVFIFILTTKVGGLGTNLTGADRVIIYDPDWNPSTDMQARERAWRIGQTRDVTVYRLITRGTIEEKVYHRQIYKHFLTNKILKNPQQRRFFKSRDMKDLFTLNEDGERGSTETSTIFSPLSEDVNVISSHNDSHDKAQSNKATTLDVGISGTQNGNKPQNKDKFDHTDGEVDEETNILRSLFDANGIHSAMNHDAILNAHDEEKIRLEEQASLVAQRAAEALRQSRMLRSQESIVVPTWTGKAGTAGAPSSVPRRFGSTLNSRLFSNSRSMRESSDQEPGHKPYGFAAGASAGKALSSSELLARIQGNEARAVGDGLEHQFGLASGTSCRNVSMNNSSSRLSHNSSTVQPEVLIRQICTFLQRRGGTTSSASIVEHFKERIPSKDLPLFKNLLKEIATLEKTSNGSSWVLKPEYEDQ